MTSTPPATTSTPPSGLAAVDGTTPPGSWEPRHRRRRRRTIVAAGATVALLAAAGVVVAITGPFAGPSSTNNGVTDNTYPISYQTVQRGPLQSQTEVQGTLTYAGPNNSTSTANIVLPAGTATSTIQEEEELVAGAHQSLSADEESLQSTEASNAESLSQADQAVSADEASLALANTSDLQGLVQAQQPVGAERQASVRPGPATLRLSPRPSRP